MTLSAYLRSDLKEFTKGRKREEERAKSHGGDSTQLLTVLLIS